MENHISVKSEYDCGSSVSRISAIYWSFVFRLTIILRPFLGRISFLFGCWLCNGWRSSVGFLSVIFRLYDGSQFCRLLLVCWASVGYQWLVDRLSVVLRLSVRCLSLVCWALCGCPLIAGRSIVAGRLTIPRVRVGNLSAVNWPTVILVELFFDLPTLRQTVIHCFPSLTW